MTDEPEMPRDWGWRYVLWILWCNSITALAIIQSAFAAVLLVADDGANPLIPHSTYRWIVLGNAIFTGVIAQVKKNNPPPPPPTKGP
jgi:hypothetical protein